MSTQAVAPRPDFGRLYGITHAPDTKVPMVRAPRVLKVGIGIPKGRAIQIFISNGKWHIRHGVWEKPQGGGKDKLVMKTVFKGGSSEAQPNTREGTEAWHNAHKNDAAISNRPQKIPYFTFTRRTIIEDAGGKPIEVFEPDFEAIEAHGDIPRRIPVILTADNPLYQEMAWWTASELKCHGDGMLAERVISAGSAKDANWQTAKDAGQKMFTYSPCALGGCPHAGVDCKPHTTLNLQLAYAMRLGATAYFTTTGIVSAGQLFSSITEIRDAVESRGYSIAGIPMDLVLGSFRANHEGKPSVQPCVSLELRAQGSKKLIQILAENSWVPVPIGNGTKLLEQPADAGVYDGTPEMLAPAISAEFSEAEYDDEETPEPVPPAAAATQAKQEDIGQQLKQRKAKAETVPAAPAPDIPWKNKADMDNVFTAHRLRVGPKAYSDALDAKGWRTGDLKPEGGVSVEFYQVLKGLPDEAAAEQGTILPTDDF